MTQKCKWCGQDHESKDCVYYPPTVARNLPKALNMLHNDLKTGQQPTTDHQQKERHMNGEQHEDSAKRSESQLDTEMRELGEVIDRVQDIAAQLAARLMPVMGPHNPPPAVTRPPKEDDISPIATSIREKKDVAENTLGVLEDISDRIIV